MTVYIEKNALNLREELASLRNQGGYQEQKFYFDGLVTNGTFDAGTVGWSLSAVTTSTQSVVGGRLRITTQGGDANARSIQTFATVVGATYVYSADGYQGTSTADPQFKLGGAANLSINFNPDGTLSGTFVAGTNSLTITLQNNAGGNGNYSEFDNVSLFETDGTDVIHTMPKGWKPKDFFEDGLLQREGAANDYEVVFDGFDYVIKPTVAPSATTQTCVIGVKA
jgi:hypothetical protein